MNFPSSNIQEFSGPFHPRTLHTYSKCMVYRAGCTCPKQKCCTCPKSKCCTCTTILYWCCTCPKCYCCTCTTLKQLLWLLPDSLLVPVALVQHNLKVLHMTYSKTAGVALARHLQKRANCGVYSCPITQMV